MAVGGRNVDVQETRISGVHCIESHANSYLYAPPHGKMGATHVVGTDGGMMGHLLYIDRHSIQDSLIGLA